MTELVLSRPTAVATSGRLHSSPASLRLQCGITSPAVCRARKLRVAGSTLSQVSNPNKQRRCRRASGTEGEPLVADKEDGGFASVRVVADTAAVLKFGYGSFNRQRSPIGPVADHCLDNVGNG